jgi:hypothetical protein
MFNRCKRVLKKEKNNIEWEKPMPNDKNKKENK